MRTFLRTASCLIYPATLVFFVFFFEHLPESVKNPIGHVFTALCVLLCLVIVAFQARVAYELLAAGYANSLVRRQHQYQLTSAGACSACGKSASDKWTESQGRCGNER